MFTNFTVQLSCTKEWTQLKCLFSLEVCHEVQCVLTTHLHIIIHKVFLKGFLEIIINLWTNYSYKTFISHELSISISVIKPYTSNYIIITGE